MSTEQQPTESRDLDFRTMNIYEKINYVSENLEGIKKNLQVTSKDNSESYKGVAAVDVIRPVEELLKKVGLIKIPQEMDYQVNGKLTTMRQSYLFVNVDSVSETFSATAGGQGFDYADKGINAASTNGIKYMYMRMFGLVAEDPEAVHSLDKVNPEQMTAPPVMGGDPYQQQMMQQQPVQQPYMQEQPLYEEPATVNPAIARFNELLEESKKANFPIDQVYMYLNGRFFPNEHHLPGGPNFQNIESIDPAIIIEASDHLDTMIKPHRQPVA
ncbi:ERF family protein [Rhodococcus sp. IEGM1300]